MKKLLQQGKCDNVVDTKCQQTKENRIVCVRETFITKVIFEKELEKPVIIGQNEKKGDGYPKYLIQSKELSSARQAEVL